MTGPSQDLQASIIWLEIATCAISAALLFWSLSDAISSKKKSVLGTNIYEDKDGIATEDSQSQYSVLWENIALGFVTVAGIVVATIEGVFSNKYGLTSKENWIDLAVWVRVETTSR
jgi:hypothetical protein